MTEVDLHCCLGRELPVPGELRPLVGGQGLDQWRRQLPHPPGEGLTDRHRIAASHGDQDREARRPFDQSPNGCRAAGSSQKEIPFPVAGDDSVVHLSGAMIDEHGLDELTAEVGGSAGSTMPAVVPQALQQFPPEFSARQDVEIPIDRLMRDPHVHVVRILGLEPNDNLFRRPAATQACQDVGMQPGILFQVRPPSSVFGLHPSMGLSRGGPVRHSAGPQPPEFSAEGAGSPPKSAGHGATTAALTQQAVDVLPFWQAQAIKPISSHGNTLPS